jgi:hypothetical protein
LPILLPALERNGHMYLDQPMSRDRLTRSRPYRKKNQAWIEQKHGAVVRKLLGYRRFQGIAAAQAITL